MTEGDYALGRSHGFTSGYWAAVNDVLNLLNTFEDRSIAKKEIYRQVSELKPAPPRANDDLPGDCALASD